MIKSIYVVFDSKTKLFGMPFMSVNQGAAIRDFEYAANDRNNDIGRYPTDFGLYFLGTFCDETAKYETLDQVQHIVSAIQLVKED